MTWNHRVIVHPHENETQYSVHEVFYESDGSLMGYVKTGVGYGETLEELKKELARITRALESPALYEADFKNIMEK